MAAKSARKSAKHSSPVPVPAEAPVAAGAAPMAGGAAAAPAEEATSWIDSADPRKKLIGKIVLVAVWVYVAALWLLALDQTFHWGIFGP